MANFEAEGDVESHEARDGGSPDTVLIIDSVDVLRGYPEVLIRHGEDIYRLRVTKAGKLYLTK